MRVMIADDEAIVRRGIIREVDWRALGVEEVLQAENGRVCLEKMAENAVDLLIADIRMPHINGVELGRMVSEKYPDCRIIFISAYTDKEYLKSAISLNVLAYVEKPIELGELTQAIEKAIAQIRNQRRQDDETSLTQLYRLLLRGRDASAAQNSLMRECAAWRYCCVQLNFDDCAQAELYVDTAAMQACFHEQGARAWVFGDIVKRNYVVVCRVKAGADAVTACQKALSVYSESRAGGHMFSAIGPEVPIQALAQSFARSEDGMSRQFFMGCGTVVLSREEGEAALEYALPTALGDKIRSALVNRISEDYISAIEEMRAALTKRVYTRESVKSAAIYVLGMVGLYGQEGQNDISGIEKAARCESLRELIALLLHEGEQILRWGNVDDRAVVGALRIITREYGNADLSIGYICDELNVSKSKLCGQFHKETGKSVNAYITGYRIIVAQEMIVRGGAAMKDIARMTGFNDLNYFYKTFKRVVGVTPSAYKEANP